MSRKPERAPLDRYLDRICRRLWLVPARERRDTREELRQHLERLAAHAARTVPTAEAMEDAMEKFGDPKQIGGELSRQHLRRRRWLSALLKTAVGTALVLLTVTIGYTAYWYIALSRPMEREPAPTPVASASSTLAAIQAAQDGYARQIQSVRFQSQQEVHEYYQGHGDRMVTHTYEVASKGDRYYSREVSDNRPTDGPVHTSHEHDVNVSDGHTLHELTERDSAADGLHGRKTYDSRVYLRDNNYKPYDADAVLQYGYKVHGVWIGDMLRRGKPVVEGTVTDARFGPLTVVRCRNRTKWGADEAVRLWLSPKLGWIAVKTEAMGADARPPFGLRMVYETRNVVRIGTLWVTREGRFHYDAVGLGRREQVADHTEQFANIAFNDVPDALFFPRYVVGTGIVSYDFQKVSVLQPSGQWKEQPWNLAPGPAPEWPFALAGVVVLGAIGFAVLRVRRRWRPRDEGPGPRLTQP